MAYLIKLLRGRRHLGRQSVPVAQAGSDTVAVGDALAEIETEKAIVEINAEHAGVLGRIVVAAGAASVPVNTVLGVLLADGEDASAIERALAEQGVTPAAAPAAAATAAAVTAAAAPAAATPLFELRRHRDLRARHGRRAAQAVPAPAGAPPSSLLARRLAAQWGVDLARAAAARMAASCAATWKRRATPRPPPASRKPPRRAPPAAACRTWACAAPSPAA